MKAEPSPVCSLIKLKMNSSADVDYTRNLISILEEQLKKEAPFGIIMLREEEQSNVPEAGKIFKNWLKHNRSLLNRYCFGVAIVTASEGVQRIYKPVAKLMISKMFGCSGEMFTNEQDATVWLLKMQMTKVK